MDLVGNDVDRDKIFSGSLSGQWCAHLAWRENSSSGV